MRGDDHGWTRPKAAQGLHRQAIKGLLRQGASPISPQRRTGACIALAAALPVSMRAMPMAFIGRNRDRRSADGLLPFKLAERRGRVARVVVVEELPAVSFRTRNAEHGLCQRGAGGDVSAGVLL